MAAAGLKPTIIAVVSSAVAFASLVGFGGAYLWQPLAAAQETQAAAQETHAELRAKIVLVREETKLALIDHERKADKKFHSIDLNSLRANLMLERLLEAQGIPVPKPVEAAP